jgi:hypothetical protein
MAGLRQTTAGRLPDQSVAAGDDRDLRHWFLPWERRWRPLPWEGRSGPTGLSILSIILVRPVRVAASTRLGKHMVLDTASMIVGTQVESQLSPDGGEGDF